ncbi:unnamed protein product [Urochloa decumbens]|uniref:Alkyl transferase n=2 Tax=Urochloa decumbens TaxID=240449 RepID=A0ABC8Z810_9POAL
MPLSSHSPTATCQLLAPSRRWRLLTPCPRAGATPAAEASALLLPGALRAESLPRHVAVVMDGNARWARARGLPSAAGHDRAARAGGDGAALPRLGRPRAHRLRLLPRELEPVEVEFLMGLFERVIHESVAEFLREGIRLRVIGDSSRLPVSLQRIAREAEAATRNNSQLDLTLAISYSGRRDIVQACRSLAQKVHDKVLRPEDIDESLFAAELETSPANEHELLPYPDLLIRTSGELRLSNFLLWQSAYSELFFTDTLWPDFGEDDYLEALVSFQNRDRRFGVRK